MKKLNWQLVGALLKKQRIEDSYPYRRGKFDATGFVLKVLLLAAILAVFAVFFGRFVTIYTNVNGVFGVEGTESRPNLHPDLRTYELLTAVYGIAFLFMTVSAVSQINRRIFDEDGAKLYAAMPIDATSLYLAKAVAVYLGQFAVAVLVVFAINGTVAFAVSQSVALGWQYWISTVAACFALPLLTMAVGSLVAMPYRWLKQFLQNKFVLNFVLVTLLTGAAFWLYSLVLDAVKQMLLGDDLKYFFDEAKMTAIVKATSCFYPIKWAVDLLLVNIRPQSLGVGHSALVASLGIVAVVAACTALSLVMLRFILQRSLQMRNGETSAHKSLGDVACGKSAFFALVKKDFLLIFRTPSYMFSYLSVAVVMPLMVYFCMSVGSSLVYSLVERHADLEIALFLTLLFGALTNVFCATNVSRDGEMFYAVKAFPLSYKSVFFAKIFLCLAITAVSQLANAIVLCATGSVAWYSAIFLFVVGTLFGFVNICVATRYDFNHARFSSDEDGEIKESSGVTSAIILLGLLSAFVVGGVVFAVKILSDLRNLQLGWVTYVASGVVAAVCALLAYFYLTSKLDKKYYEFEGGM